MWIIVAFKSKRHVIIANKKIILLPMLLSDIVEA